MSLNIEALPNKIKGDSMLTDTDFDETVKDKFSQVRVKIEFIREYIGGVPADDKGLRAYIINYLKVDDVEDALQRIKNEDLGVKEEEGDVKIEKTYGVNSCYRNEDGEAWIPDFQIKACMKHALSDLGLFKKKIGSKGTIAELGSIHAHGISNHDFPHRIYFIKDDQRINTHEYKTFRGSVSTPQGKMSIVHTNEHIKPGAQAEFIFKWFKGKLVLDDIKTAFGLMRKIGLGSAKSYENGQFKILEFEEHE